MNLPSAPLLLDAKSLQRCVEATAVTAAEGSGNGAPDGPNAAAGMASTGRAAGGGWVITGGDSSSGGSAWSARTAALQGVVLLAWQGGDAVPDLVSSIRRQHKVRDQHELMVL